MMNDLEKRIALARALGIAPVPVEATHGTQAFLYEADGVPVGQRVHKPYDFSVLATLARNGKRGNLAYGDSVNMNVTRWLYRGEG